MAYRKVCFVIAAFSGGGVNRVVSNLANVFVARGIKVDVVALSSEYYETKELYAPEVNLVSLDASRALAFMPLWKFFLKNNAYDAVISSVDFVNVHTIIACKLARVNSTVMVVTHTNLSEEKKHNKSKMLKIVYKISSLLYLWADHVCAVSAGVAVSMDKELGLANINIQVIYNPIVHQKEIGFLPDIPHHWYKEDIPVIMGCGRLTKQKNFQMLISAFATLIKHNKVRLILLGDGEQKEELCQQIERLNLDNHVYLAGNVSNPLDYFYYSRMLVSTSQLEGFGNVIVEALSMGCPVIATDCPSGPSEILENGRWGKLVKMNDETALYNMMMDELAHEKISRTYLQNRANDFLVDTIADQYLSLCYSKKEIL